MNETLIRAFQALDLWKTQAAPSDWQAGADSTAWAPMAAVIQHCAANAGTPQAKAAVHAQVVSLLNQAAAEISASCALGPAERLASSGYVQQLLAKYRPLAHV